MNLSNSPAKKFIPKQEQTQQSRKMASFSINSIVQKSPFSEPPENQSPGKFIPKLEETLEIRRMAPFSINSKTEIAVFCGPIIFREIHPEMEGNLGNQEFRFQLTLVQKSPFSEPLEFTSQEIRPQTGASTRKPETGSAFN